jgi:hypothetical protein
MIKKQFFSNYVYYTLLFFILFVFFAKVHPLLPYDIDDWKYCGIARLPYPWLGLWNPTKIFPECFQPLVGLIAAHFVTPIIGDYLTALVVSHAFVVTIFIIGYFFSIQKLLEWRFQLTKISALGIITVLVLLHFLALITRSTDNGHLFYSPDVNCYYNYIIPNMLCASLATWILRHDLTTIKSNTAQSLLLFLTFLAIFSNLYSSAILIAVVGAKLLLRLFESDKKEQRWLIKYIRNNAFLVFVIIVWLIVQLFEANGRRAHASEAMMLSFGESMKTTIAIFLSVRYNKWFLLLTVSAILAAVIHHSIKEKRNPFRVGKLSAMIVLALLLTVTYMILLSSQVLPQYLYRSEVKFSYLFFYILLVALGLGYLTSKVKYFKHLYPFLIFFLFFIGFTNENTYIDVQKPYGTDLQTCETFDRSFINQVKNADLMGMDTVTIYVHDYKNTTNWPLMLHQGKYIGITLHKHGITKRRIETIFVKLPEGFDADK